MDNTSNAVSLRAVIDSDIPIFFEQQLDPEATQMADFPSREREAFMAHWTKILGNPANTTRTILWGGQVAGNMCSWDQDGKREVGYWIGKEYWGKGIATAALALLIAEVPIRPLYGYVVTHNIGSRRVLEKCGFVVDSTDNEGFLLKLE